MHKKFKAFTIIELLVVIAIVGILSGFIFVSMSGALNSAKDAKRQADLASIQHAIMAYMAENNNAFPESSASCTMGSGGTCSNLSTNLTPYLKTIPLDPNGTNYTYTYSSSTSSFTIQGTLSNGNTYYYDSSSGTWSQTSNPFVGWLYKKTITLSSTLTQDYQIQLTIPYGAGGCESHCKSDFSDLRFASTSGTTLNYWIESYTVSTTATVWVKVLNASSSFVMYYGKSDAATTASGDNTFEFFDHFDGSTIDAAKWTNNGITWSVLGSLATYSSGDSYMTSKISFATNYALRVRSNIYSSAGKYDYFGFYGGSNSHAIGYIDGYAFSAFNGSANRTSLTAYDAQKIWDICRNGTTNVLYYMDGTLLATRTENVSSDTRSVIINANYTKLIFDWIAVRKYIASEPTPSFGTEQNN